MELEQFVKQVYGSWPMGEELHVRYANVGHEREVPRQFDVKVRSTNQPNCTAS